MIVVAIDPSLTQTAVVLGTSPADYVVSLHQSKPLGDTVAHRVRRYDALVHGIMTQIEQHAGKPAVQDVRIFVESYAYGAKCAREILGEFGGILRWHLVDYDQQLSEVPILSLKKFTTGKGAGKKDHMMMHCLKNWGFESLSSDHCDAYSLFRFGLCVIGLDEPKNAIQREVVSKFITKEF
jgi:Holliday junction resolvasome RuvABC endonuclease subunit